MPEPEYIRPAADRSFAGNLIQRSKTLFKMGLIFFLTLFLLVPLRMIRSVLDERMERRNEAVADITSTWGAEQVVAGPVLIVPYKYTQKTFKDQVVNGRAERVEAVETLTARAYFLPDSLGVTSELLPERRRRGIYETVVYRGSVQLSGRFAPPSFEDWKVPTQDVQWADAEIALSVTDLRGAQEALSIKLGDRSHALAPGGRLPGLGSGVHAKLKDFLPGGEPMDFSLSLTFNGSRSIRFAPFGKSNHVSVSSPWPDPSFQGAFLPAKREISSAGFAADWQVSYYGRSYPQQWTDRPGDDRTPFDDVARSLFGVDLYSAVDSYRTVERAIKYGVLFLALAFTAFFLFEILARLRIHAFQYTLVGAALCLFYLALLSLSEVIAFGKAYLVGSAAATVMITLYCASVLKSGGRAAGIGVGLAAVYGFLFVILKLQDFSLLVGTAGLFAVLAVVMFATRKIDWYSRDSQ